MMHTITQKVPICPDCKAGMHMRVTMFGVIYICNDCNAMFRVLGVGQTENEVIVGDNLKDDLEKGIMEVEKDVQDNGTNSDI